MKKRAMIIDNTSMVTDVSIETTGAGLFDRCDPLSSLFSEPGNRFHALVTRTSPALLNPVLGRIEAADRRSGRSRVGPLEEGVGASRVGVA